MTNETQTDRLAEVLDWRAVAKSAGNNGIRYRTNAALVKFLTEIAGVTSLSTDIANAQQRVKQLEAENARLREPAVDAIEILDVLINEWNDAHPHEPEEIITCLQSRFRAVLTTGKASA